MIQCPLPGVPGVNYRVVQLFGQRPEVYAQFGLKGHNGIDLAPRVPGLTDVVVYAPHDGVCSVREDNGYGKYVDLLDKDDGRKSILAHLSKYFVSNGQLVRMGDPIGIMGTTGFSTGIHLHWGYKRVNADGITLKLNNGYKGAIDVYKYATLPAIGPDKKFLVLGSFPVQP